MKKIALILCAVMLMTVFTSCQATRRDMTPPEVTELPTGFTMIRSAGNGYFLYSSPIGYFLVSRQVQGDLQIGSPNRFIDMVYIGKELVK